MTDPGQQPPPGIDATVATAARMYDYWLGGHDNFAADRTWAPACPPAATCTRWRRRSRPGCGSFTSTTTVASRVVHARTAANRAA